MKHLSYITAVIVALCTISCTKQRQSQPLAPYLTQYNLYRVQVDGVDSYYFNSSVLLDFNADYGQSSGNIFDFDGSGLVDSGDLADAMSGWGEVCEPNYDIESAQVLGQFSSGWILDLDGWEVCFLKVTPSDEGGEFIPETLNSFFLEGERNGQTWKVWYHAY